MSAPLDDLTGRTLDGRYVLKARIGAGGMGAVYRAEQVSMERTVAVKVISPALITDERVTGRFLREARLCGRIAHARVVSVFDFGRTDDGIHYLVMEHLSGRTLAEALADGPLPPARAVDLAIQIGEALQAAHGLGIIHRDLKPGNVMLLDTPDGSDAVKVLDFGLARSLEGDDTPLTQSGTMFGTPTYMSPEVAKGQGCDTRGDLYALGTILYELLSGAPPFTGTNALALAMHHAFQAPPTLPTVVSPALTRLVTQLLEKDPDDRPADVAEVRERLLATPEHRGSEPTPATGPTSAPPAPAPTRKTLSGRVIILIFLLFSGATGLLIRGMLMQNPTVLAPSGGPVTATPAGADAVAPGAARPDAAPADAGPAAPADAAPADPAPPQAAPTDAAARPARRPPRPRPVQPPTAAPATRPALPGAFIRPG
ncbi:MAG: serine/threonine-protein kinase [bacterium]